MNNSVTASSLANASPAKLVNELLQDKLHAAPLSPAEMQVITQAIPTKTFKKGTYLLREGQMATTSYSVIQGCVREFYLIDGEEKTTAFFTEGDSISSGVSGIQRTPAKQYWECVEDTTLLVITHEKEKELYRRFPRLESLCRIEVEEKFGTYQQTMAMYINSTPEERYLNLLKNRPDLLDRVPQYQLASYIGVKPESLSRIRRRILEKC